MRLDFEAKITAYHLQLDAEIKIVFADLYAWYEMVVADERLRITVLIETEINQLNINYIETMKIKTAHFLLLIETEINRL
jgi:hypothetical protein